jgi:hypothetical protein
VIVFRRIAKTGKQAIVSKTQGKTSRRIKFLLFIRSIFKALEEGKPIKANTQLGDLAMFLN